MGDFIFFIWTVYPDEETAEQRYYKLNASSRADLPDVELKGNEIEGYIRGMSPSWRPLFLEIASILAEDVEKGYIEAYLHSQIFSFD